MNLNNVQHQVKRGKGGVKISELTQDEKWENSTTYIPVATKEDDGTMTTKRLSIQQILGKGTDKDAEQDEKINENTSYINNL